MKRLAIEHAFSIDTGASRQHLRDVVVRAGIGIKPEPDWPDISCAASVATNVTVFGDLDHRWGRPDNGVRATRQVLFRDRKAYLNHPGESGTFERQTVLGVMALLKAFPDADAFWETYGGIPTLLRCGGMLVVTAEDGFWNDRRLAIVDLPHVQAPLGPWPSVDL